jgi:hypothetical protein
MLAGCSIFDVAMSKVAADASHTYVPSFCILNISKGSSTGGVLSGATLRLSGATLRIDGHNPKNWRARHLNAVASGTVRERLPCPLDRYTRSACLFHFDGLGVRGYGRRIHGHHSGIEAGRSEV